MASKRRLPKAPPVGHNLTMMENCQRIVPLKLVPFERFLKRAARKIGVSSTSVFVRLVTDGEMARLNRTFRTKSKTTDVLSFPSETRSKPAKLRARAAALRKEFLGDIAISPAVARRNAKLFGRTLREEICILMLHGVLHLMGYDHETDRGEMEREEARLRRRLGLAG
jgi:probable rRNA maturation factor